MRHRHYWKKAGPAAAPSEILCFDTETLAGPESEVEGGEFHTLRLGVATAYRLERGRRTRQKTIRFKDDATFWAFVVERTSRQRPLWVFGHNLGYDLAAVRGYRFLGGEDFAAEKVILDGSILLIQGFVGGNKIVFCDTFNYYKCSLASIGKSVGLAKMAMPAWSAPDDEWFAYCERDVEVTCLAVDNLIQFVRQNELGPWQPTIASLAFSALRSRFMTHKVLVHDDKEALAAERLAYYGGIVDTPFVGRVPASPIYELDVCSMYPAVCRNELPVEHKGNVRRPPLGLLRKLLGSYQVVASVTLRTSAETYPCRVGKRVFYPTGTYQTQLCTPELVEALKRNHVLECTFAAYYKTAPVFKSYMEWMVGQKTAFRAGGNEAFSVLCKYYANSLYGKTGQLTPRWQPWEAQTFRQLELSFGLPEGALAHLDNAPVRVSGGEQPYLIPDMGVSFDVRSQFGIVEIKTGQTESRDSNPALAGHVTSFARVLLRSYQRTANHLHYYYSDTDSVWVDSEGLSRLREAGHVQAEALGFLGLAGEYESLTVHGRKDYQADGKVRRKGVRANAYNAGSGYFIQLQFPGARKLLLEEARDGVYCPWVVKRLARRPDHCVVGPDGWTRPLRFPQEIPFG